MITPTVSSGSVLLAGMYGTTFGRRGLPWRDCRRSVPAATDRDILAADTETPGIVGSEIDGLGGVDLGTSTSDGSDSAKRGVMRFYVRVRRIRS